LAANAWNTGCRPSAGARTRDAGFPWIWCGDLQRRTGAEHVADDVAVHVGSRGDEHPAAVLHVRGEQFAAVPLQPAAREQEHGGMRREAVLGPGRQLCGRHARDPKRRTHRRASGQRVLHVKRVAVHVA
jgi:hypothetical protein